MAESASKPFEMFDIFAPTAEMLSHLLFEEFVMLVLAVVPLFLGLVAALQVMTGITKGPLDAEESENVRAGAPHLAYAAFASSHRSHGRRHQRWLLASRKLLSCPPTQSQ